MRALDLLLLASLAAAPGCRRDEVTHFQVKKAPPVQASAGPMAGSMMAGPMAGSVVPQAPVAEVEAGRGLHWTLPAKWLESHPGGMRYATLKPAEQGAEVSVIVLPGDAGGELANVNRWRGQLGLPAQDAAALAAARQAVTSQAGAVSLYDFASEGQKNKSRMIAGLISARDNTWFFKLSGDDAAAGAAKAAFIKLLESLALEADR